MDEAFAQPADPAEKQPDSTSDIDDFELGSDIEEIPPIDEPDKRTMTIKYGGKEYEVWFTNNLPMTFAQWWRATHPDNYVLHDFDLENKKLRLDPMHFDEIMAQVQAKYPKLFEALVELTDESEERRERGIQLKKEGKLPSGVYTAEQIRSGNFGHTPEQEAALAEIQTPSGYGEEQAFYFSKAFEAMVPIARQIDPGYDIHQFTA